MRKCNADNIGKFLDFVLEKTKQIDILLFDENETKDFEKIADIYKKRGEALQALKTWYDTEQGFAQIQNSEKYRESLAEIEKIDRKILSELKSKVGVLGEKLKRLHKQKSVLIYSKSVI